MMEWNWEAGSVLYSDSPYISPGDVFHAVCNELGRYYTQYGKKYTKSRPAIKWAGKHLKYQVEFWSSRSNITEKFVNFEIVLTAYPFSLDGLEGSKCLSIPLRKEKSIDNLSHIIVKQIDGSITERKLQNNEKPDVIRSNHCNIWGIDIKLFEKIIEYIDVIINQAEQFESRKTIDLFLAKIPEDELKYFWAYHNNELYYRSLCDY